MCVRWGEINSDCFNAVNGVHSGRTLSSKILSNDMDDLSNELVLCNLGAISMIHSWLISHSILYCIALY